MNQDLIKFLIKRGYFILGEGRNRITLTKNKKTVVKIPKNDDGDVDNRHEAICFKSGDNPELAKCRLLNGHLLVMEYIDLSSKGKPDWAGFYDCEQVGLSRKGEWKAYDYGLF